LAHARRKNPAFSAAAPTVPDVNGGAVTTGKEPLIARRRIEAHPFVPADKEERNRHCQEVLTIQAHGLSRRLRHINCQTTVIGISGGLDSTLALLATCEAYRLNDWSLKGIIGITMPGFGTTDRTLANALQLMEELGITIRQIPISAAVRQHFQDIGHDPALKDITYENSQARERTQILMDVANQVGGLVIGTGDLSELALGWCTYNGDHMSMYGLNGAVPKTLLRSIVRFVAEQQPGSRISELLLNILDTPISPELLPPNEEGQITQHTEDSTGPYELHDFFIYHTVKNGFTPRKIYALAVQVFTQPAVPATAESGPGLSREQYDADTILHWLKIFYRRFFGQQFKRSAMPDGPKIGSIGFSPRGAWQMPSDADVTAWTEDLDSF
jgi:NAD+ synthase (glutamine-hydrolysing)